ncbi:SR- and CTD-associated factor 8 [Geranomyces michiganensis]|nr:SR- and CTD-associated factor 8 [Geranomyces michiganensis]
MSLRDSLEFDKELHSLYETKIPVSASKISALTKLAVKHAKLYKNVVFSIEKFVQKCPPELKLAGLYVIDSIARAIAKHPEEGESYIARFEEKLDSIIPHLLQAPAKDKDRIKRTVGLWKKSSLFNSAVIQELERKYFDVTDVPASGTPPAGIISDPRFGTPTSVTAPADPRLAGALNAGAAAGLPASSTSGPLLGLNSSALSGLDPSILQALGGMNSQLPVQGGLDLNALLPLLQAQQQQQDLISSLLKITGTGGSTANPANASNVASALSGITGGTSTGGAPPDLSNLNSLLQSLGSAPPLAPTAGMSETGTVSEVSVASG